MHAEHSHQAQNGHHHRHANGGAVVVIRPNSGLSGDILVAGLSVLAGPEKLDERLAALNLGNLIGRVKLVSRQVSQIAGMGLEVDLPKEHEHRHLKDIEEFFARAEIDDQARQLAVKAFRILAEAESAVHNRPVSEIHFHEVGALDSIMDIGLSAVLLTELAPTRLVCGPLPICDGVIRCQHGLLPAPAPAVLRLMEGVPVIGLASRGETVTPTALALLKAAGAEFGLWPALVVEKQTLAYGGRILPYVPNGAIFIRGREHSMPWADETPPSGEVDPRFVPQETRSTPALKKEAD